MKTFNEFSFGGCSWGCIFYIGCIKALYDLKLTNNCKVICCSAGCIAGISLLLNKDYNKLVEIYSLIAEDCRNFGSPIGNMSYLLKKALNLIITDDNCVKILNNKLTIVYTKFPSMNLKKKSFFKNKNDLIDTCLASSYIPFYFTDFKFDNYQICLDCGFINNNPILSNKTIKFGVKKPYKIDSNINISNTILINIYNPPEIKNYKNIVRDGYIQTLKYFKNS